MSASEESEGVSRPLDRMRRRSRRRREEVRTFEQPTHVALEVRHPRSQQTLTSLGEKVGLLDLALGGVDVRQIEGRPGVALRFQGMQASPWSGVFHLCERTDIEREERKGGRVRGREDVQSRRWPSIDIQREEERP